jgi:hypothetical protein
MNTHAIEVLLKHSASLETAVKDLSQRICAANESSPYNVPGLTYNLAKESLGFSVHAHGRVLLPWYEQVTEGDGDFPKLFARITLCFPDRDGHPDEPVFTISMDSIHGLSIDGTPRFYYDMTPANSLDYSRQQLSYRIGSAIRRSCQSFKGSTARPLRRIILLPLHSGSRPTP